MYSFPKREGTGYLPVKSDANHWDLYDRRAWRTGAREIEGGMEGYVVSVGSELGSGWWPEGSGGRLKDTRLAEVGRVGKRHGGLAMVRGLWLGVVAV
jgi:hypothetical protein